jgi:hypothetical protein
MLLFISHPLVQPVLTGRLTNSLDNGTGGSFDFIMDLEWLYLEGSVPKVLSVSDRTYIQVIAMQIG